MKKLTLFCMLACMGLIAFAQNSQDQEIINAIQADIKADYNRDLVGMQASWQHNANVYYVIATHQFMSEKKGWDSVNAMLERDVKAYPKPDTTGQMKADNFSVHADGDMATVSYVVSFIPNSDQSSIFPYMGTARYHVHELLMKENGQWKTNTTIITLPQSYDAGVHAAEADVNAAGYEMLTAKKFDQAIEIFKLNVKLFPDSWNTYDSLGEAYADAGDTKNAIANYEKSLQLNPASEGGKAALAKLKKK